MKAMRITRILAIWLGISMILYGCAEALRTGAPVILQPSPSLASVPSADRGTPLAEAASSVPISAEATPTATPAQEAQFSPPDVIPMPTDIPIVSEPTTVITIVPPTLPALSSEQKWRTQQQNRQVFDEPQPYTTSGSQLWWYDPINQQHVILGNITGKFDAQARFELVGQGVEALEVPYAINQSFGLTALSPALVQRLEAAGYTQWVETYVIIGPAVQQRQGRS